MKSDSDLKIQLDPSQVDTEDLIEESEEDNALSTARQMGVLSSLASPEARRTLDFLNPAAIGKALEEADYDISEHVTHLLNAIRGEGGEEPDVKVQLRAMNQLSDLVGRSSETFFKARQLLRVSEGGPVFDPRITPVLSVLNPLNPERKTQDDLPENPPEIQDPETQEAEIQEAETRTAPKRRQGNVHRVPSEHPGAAGSNRGIARGNTQGESI